MINASVEVEAKYVRDEPIPREDDGVCFDA